MVSIHYDPMLAKVISYAPTRRQSALVLADALARAHLHGLRTNRELLVNVLRHPAFLDGATDTAFFDTHGLAELAAPLADADNIRLSAIAAALADAAHNRATATVFGSIPSGWRNVASGYQVKTYRDGGDVEYRIEYRFTRTGLQIAGDDSVRLVSATPNEVVLAGENGVARRFTVASYRTSSSIPPAARCTWLRCPASRSRVRPSNKDRWWHPCRATSSGWAPMLAIPSPPVSH